MYYVHEVREEFKSAIAENTKSSKVLETWHRRMDHLNVQDLLKADRDKSLLGIKLEKCSDKLDCDICVHGKMIRTPFPKGSVRKTTSLEIIHSDLCGPMRVESNGKSKYFITFIDDHSKWCEIRFL